jgi:hypothetical protein
MTKTLEVEYDYSNTTEFFNHCKNIILEKFNNNEYPTIEKFEKGFSKGIYQYNVMDNRGVFQIVIDEVIELDKKIVVNYDIYRF